MTKCNGTYWPYHHPKKGSYTFDKLRDRIFKQRHLRAIEKNGIFIGKVYLCHFTKQLKERYNETI